MPSSVVSAWSGPASDAPSFVALSAAGIPSLQIKIFMAKLQFVTGHERVNDNGGADQWQRYEREADFGTGKILGRNRADLSADRRARVHDECDQNIDVAFDRVSKGPVAGGNDDFKQIGAHSKVGR